MNPNWLSIGLMLCTGLMAGPLQGQRSVSDSNRWARDYNGFALICRSLDLEPVSNVADWMQHSPNRRIMVVFGSRIRSRDLPVDLDEFVADGGAVLFASDGNPNGLPGVNLDSYRLVDVVDEASRFMGYPDCPIVSSLGDHPVVNGVRRIATNTSGRIRITNDALWTGVAELPETGGIAKHYFFMVAPPTGSSQRVLFCADQSAFSNQMLFQMDNARLALQAMHWLKTGSRDQLLIVSDGQSIAPEDPQAVQVDIPPPSREDVLNALQSLPPEMLLRFGNEVARMVEDEGLPNELLEFAIEDVSNRNYYRSLLFLLTACLGGYLFYRYLASESTVQDAMGTETLEVNRDKMSWFSKRTRAARDRQKVARELVARFYARATRGEANQYHGFPNRLEMESEHGPGVAKEMKSVGNQVRWKSHRWWTGERLRTLKQQIDYWEELLDKQQIRYRSRT